MLRAKARLGEEMFINGYALIVKQNRFEKFSIPHIIRICLGVLRTLGFYINFRQLAINGHSYCVLAHALSPQRAEARLGEEMLINGYALITWKWALTTIPTAMLWKTIKAH